MQRLAERQPFVCDGLGTRTLNEEPARIDEEDVSAQEARAQARAWLHGPHGFEGRSTRARSSSGQGAQAALGLTAAAGLEDAPVLPMIRRRADFEAIGRNGQARATPQLVLRWMRTDRAESRIGLSTPRSLGGAVQRNRVRRRLRELVRARLERIGPGWDLLLIARPAAGEASHAELGAAIDALLERSEIGR
jgi:ribonuclease P protein component